VAIADFSPLADRRYSKANRTPLAFALFEVERFTQP
jgi:hypothetical protein